MLWSPEISASISSSTTTTIPAAALLWLLLPFPALVGAAGSFQTSCCPSTSRQDSVPTLLAVTPELRSLAPGYMKQSCPAAAVKLSLLPDAHAASSGTAEVHSGLLGSRREDDAAAAVPGGMELCAAAW